MTDRISFGIPSTATSQTLTLTANASILSAAIFPAVANPNDPAYRRDGKALVSLAGGGATWQSFNIVNVARGTAPTATNTNPGLIAGNTYVIEGLQSGDKLAFFSQSVASAVTITPI